MIDTLRAIAPGTSATYSCREAGPYSSALSAVCRLNQTAGRKEYSGTTSDNGITYTITRNA